MGFRCLIGCIQSSSDHTGLDAPGMSFSDYPVFRTLNCRCLFPSSNAPHKLPCPFKAFTRLTPAKRFSDPLGSHRRSPSCLSAAQKRLLPFSASRIKVPEQRGYQPPPEPTRRFYALDGPCHETLVRRRKLGPSLNSDRVSFTPAALIGFAPTGL